MTDVGRVSLVGRGPWKSSTAYKRLDVVYYNGTSYLAIADSTGVTPTNTTYWMILSEKGEKGDNTTAAQVTYGTGSVKDALDNEASEISGIKTYLSKQVMLDEDGTFYVEMED